jgi:chromosome segregation protein
MTGFKSFATKTVVDFMPGVTVVVGPNGCGKSNVFDAVRWVLGEQSAKSLRGSKMGDVIFQGSATYKPMGCSQVNLVINNEDGRLPIDFTEVSITRRLYRSGESEYLLNKVPCRLRDIQELFLDTGVGTESYSAMEQGRVDEIVRAKPEERRLLFEEAAGISKYKARKAEALRKLEKTEHDLIRLADRIAECKTRTISLKRAAAKAERYKGLRDTADSIEKKLLAMDMRRVSADFEKIEKAFREAKDRLGALQAQGSAVEARREELLLKAEEADQLLRDLSIRKEDQRQYINDAAAEIMRLRNLAENEQRRARDLLEQIAENDLRKDEISANLADTNAEEARLRLRLISLEAKQNIRRAEYERLRSDTETTRTKIRDLRKALEAGNNESQRLRNESTRLKLLLEQSGAYIEEFGKQKTDHEARIAALSEDIERKREHLEARRAELKKLQESLSTSQTEGLAELRERDTLRAEHRKAEQRLHEARSRLNALERLAKDYEGYYRGVKSVMLAAAQHELDGVIGVVPELIQSIESAHDLAIEVALGNHTQDIVVRTDDDAKKAIEFLKSTRRGQATFLPLNVIDGREGGPDIEEILRGPGIIGLASRLVSYDRYIEKALINLLGRTIVTQDLDISMQLIRQGKRQRYVTLEGELTFPSGAMTGGSRQQSQIITRQREISDLGRQVEELANSEKDFQQRITKREENMLRLDAECAMIREKVQDLRVELGQIETELASLRESRDQRVALFQSLRERADSSRTSSEQLTREMRTCTAALEEVETRARAQRDELGLMEEAVYERNAEVDQLGDHVSQNDQEITHLRARCVHLGENAGSFAGQRQSFARRATQLANDRERSFLSAKGYLEQAGRVEGEKAALEKEVAQIDDRRHAAAKTKEEAQNASHQESERAQKLVRELNEATNRHSETQETYVNAQATLRQLRQRAGERFNTTIESLLESAGQVEENREQLVEELDSLTDDLNRMGPNINLGALIEYQEENERYEFLTRQQTDLMQARDSLMETIATVDKTTRELFLEAFENIRRNFIEMYRALFGGGKADLVLQEVEDGDPLLDGGVDIIAQPPGKKLQNVSLLSGGEKALTAVSLMFAIFLYKPSPFCVMDEIDAPLDDVNVMRFREKLREFSKRTQFIIITHNKITMELADTIYGITMQETGVSNLVSVSFDQVEKLAASAS